MHERENDLGFYSNIWMLPVTYIKLTSSVIDVPIKKRRLVSQDKSLKSEVEFLKCKKDFVRKTYLEAEVRNSLCYNFTPCCVPQLKALFGNDIENQLPYCATYHQYQCFHMKLSDALELAYEGSSCGEASQTVTSYDFRTMENTAAAHVIEDNQALMYVYYESKKVIEEKEYLLLDFNAIVGTIGGSLGMFIGISMLDVIKWGLDKIRRIFIE